MNIKELLDGVLVGVSFLLLIDAMSFFMWIELGQTPTTSVYAGMITANIIKFFFL